MTADFNFRRMCVVLVLVMLAGGVLFALVGPRTQGEAGSTTEGAFAGSLGNLSSGSGVPSFTDGASQYDVSGSSSPSTLVLGETTVVQTLTATSTATATEDLVNETGQPAASSGSIEFFANLTLTVSNPATSLQRAGSIASALGGYVAESTYGTSEAAETVRVPSVNYQQALSQLETLGTIVSATSSSDDVSVQYADLNATLQSLVTEQASLLRLLNLSTSVNATLTIESVLQRTDAQINSVESSILQTSQLISYATISVNLLQTQAAELPLSIRVVATPLSGMSPLSVTFNAVVKGGVQPYVVNYNFGDGTSAQGQQLIHTFTQAGRYNITVSATDQSGNATLTWVVVTVTGPPASQGLSAFGSSVLGLFARVIEGIVEVAVVVVPVGLALYVSLVPALKRYSKSKTHEPAADETHPGGESG